MVSRPASISFELDSRGRREFSLVCRMEKDGGRMGRWGGGGGGGGEEEGNSLLD